jgi:hypothetical protein
MRLPKALKDLIKMLGFSLMIGFRVGIPGTLFAYIISTLFGKILTDLQLILLLPSIILLSIFLGIIRWTETR